MRGAREARPSKKKIAHLFNKGSTFCILSGDWEALVLSDALQTVGGASS